MANCIDCGKEVDYRQKRCRSCYDKSRERKQTCLYCSALFKASPSQDRKYCSKKCEGLARTGENNSFYGKHHTIETKEKLSKRKTGISVNKGIDNPMWKENAGYGSIHSWIWRNKPIPDKCEICGLRKPKDAALIKGKEHKKDINNYQFLCHKCHGEYDSGRKWTEIQKQKLKEIALKRKRDAKNRFLKE